MTENLQRSYMDRRPCCTVEPFSARRFYSPGNHDVQREVDRTNRQAARLVERLRSGDESLDEALASESEEYLLESRQANDLDFTEGSFLGITVRVTLSLLVSETHRSSRARSSDIRLEYCNPGS